MKLAYALVFNTKKRQPPAAKTSSGTRAVMFLASLILYILYESRCMSATSTR